MAKTKISEFDVDPANNTDINSINIAEGCAPSGINNAIRQLMSDLKEFQTGAASDSFTVGGAFSANGGATLGDASGDALTINSSAVSIPNGLNFDSNTFVIDATNNIVGVGAASPSVYLSSAYNLVVGSGSGDEGMTIASTGVGDIAFGDATTGVGRYAGLIRYDHSNDNLSAWTNSTERMRLDSSGNLGLGVTPSAWTGNTFKAIEIGYAGNSFAGQVGASQVSVSSNCTYISGNWTYANSSVAASQYYQSAGSHKWQIAPSGTAGNAITFTQAMTLNASGRLLIGDTTGSADGKLLVQDTGTYTIGAYNSTAVAANVGSSLLFSAGAGANRLGAIGGYFSGAATTDGGYLNFSTRAVTTGAITERMRLDTSGNLGLGVTPSAWGATAKAIQINTGGVVYSTGASAGIGSNFYYDGTNSKYLTTNYASSYYQSNGSHAWNIAASGTAGNAITFTQAMTLDASGNLGIGTTSPTQKLHVYESTAATDVFTRIGNTTAGLNVGVLSSGIGSVNMTSNYALAFSTNNTERMRITSDGYLRMASGSGGIQFNGDTAAANALDDYEEGTFTPTLTYTTPGTVSVTYATRLGFYTKVGNLVTVSMTIVLSAFTKGTATGDLRLTGLPFTSNSTAGYYAVGSIMFNNTPTSTTAGNFPLASIAASASNVTLLYSTNNSTQVVVDPDANSSYYITITYMV